MGVRRVHPFRKHKAISSGIILPDTVAAEANTPTMLNFRWEVENLNVQEDLEVECMLAQCSFYTGICPRCQN